MPPVHRRGDATDCPSTPASYSANVFANSLNVVRKTDTTNPPHQSTYTGTSTVYVNSLAIQVIGSSLDCGDVATEGSADVFAALG